MIPRSPIIAQFVAGLVGVLILAGCASTELSVETESIYNGRIRPLMLEISEELTELGFQADDEREIPMSLTKKKVCCDGLGMEMTRFTAELPPVTIEASADQVAAVLEVVNSRASARLLLEDPVTKWSPKSGPMTTYRGKLQVGDEFWIVWVKFRSGTQGFWLADISFET